MWVAIQQRAAKIFHKTIETLNMKKSLITSALLVAAGTASAELTVTGVLEMGYRAGSYATNPAGFQVGIDPRAGLTTSQVSPIAVQDLSGFGVSKADLNFGLSEDLGNGIKLVGKMGIVGASRSGDANFDNGTLWGGNTPTASPPQLTPPSGVGGGDTSMTLLGSMGALTIASEYLPDYVSGGLGGTASVGGVEMNGKITLNRAVRNYVAYTAPSMISGLTLQLAHIDANALPGLAAPHGAGASIGIGTGESGNPATINQRLNAVIATYKDGAFIVNAQVLNADNKTYTAPFNDLSSQTTYRISGNYDFGSLKVGAAMETDILMTGQLQFTNVVAAVPVGPWKFSANYALEQVTGELNPLHLLALTNSQNSGFGIAVEYTLSKKTKIVANYVSWDPTFGNAPSRSSETNLLLSQSF